MTKTMHKYIRPCKKSNHELAKAKLHKLTPRDSINTTKSFIN